MPSSHSLVPPIYHSDIFKVCSGSSASLKKLCLSCDSIRSPFIGKLVALCPLLEDVKIEVLPPRRSVYVSMLYAEFFSAIGGPAESRLVVLDIADLRKLKLKEFSLRLGSMLEPCLPGAVDPSLQRHLEEVLTGQSLLQTLVMEAPLDHRDRDRLAAIVDRDSPDLSMGVIDVGGLPILIRDGEHSIVSPNEMAIFRVKNQLF